MVEYAQREFDYEDQDDDGNDELVGDRARVSETERGTVEVRGWFAVPSAFEVPRPGRLIALTQQVQPWGIE